MEICYSCRKPINGTTLTALGRHYHQNCFACSKCRNPIRGNFLVGDNQQPVCGNCRQDVGVSSFCANCNKPVHDSIITALGLKWHPDCFRCSECNNRISSEFNSANGRPLCMGCYRKHPSSAHFGSMSDDICTSCLQKIQHGTIVKAQNKSYHKSCFVCASCKAQIVGEFNTSDSGQIYCLQCYTQQFAKRCQTCHAPISDTEFTVFEGQNYHHGCFRCTICGKGLAGQVLSRSNTGGVCCVTHDKW